MTFYTISGVIPSKVNSGWVLIGNPPGYGKTYLINKWGSQRDTLFQSKKFGSVGPVLRVDFASAQSAEHAQKL